jgi:phospholipid-transporting ATPase
VTIEVVKFQQAQLINSDLDMYYAPTDTPALCRTSALVEELGQIEYVFSDKTGTLTRNEMEFRYCSVAGTGYAAVVDEAKRGEGEGEEKDGWKTFDEMRALLEEEEAGSPFGTDDAIGSRHEKDVEREATREFLMLLAVCHTVIPDVRDGRMVFRASSPDEAALVAGAELLGYQFHVSTSPLSSENGSSDRELFPFHGFLGLNMFSSSDSQTPLRVRPGSGRQPRD